MVIELIKAKNFTNISSDYPQDIGALEDKAEEYSEMYDYITKGKKADSYDDFEFHIEKLYKRIKELLLLN